MPRVALLLSVCLLAGCARSEAEVARAPQPSVDRSLPPAVLDTAEVRDFAKIVDAHLRLRPDRRFLLAVSDVYELATGTRVQPEIAFDGKAWKVTASGRELGSLPEVPTFEDGLALVTRVARDLNAKGVTAADAEKVAQLNAQLTDKLGLADPIRARGLALLAIARASGAKDTDATAKTIAGVLGYGNAPALQEGGLKPRPTLSPELAKLYDEAQNASQWYEGYDLAVNHYGSRDAAHGFLNDIEASSPIQTQVRDWFTFIILAKYEGGGDVKPRTALARTALVGGAQRAWLLERYGDALGAWDRDLRQAALDLFPQLDTRPAEMYEAGLLAQRVLQDPVRRAKYLVAAPDDGTRAWAYSLVGDGTRLREIAESKSQSPAQRAIALSSLGELRDADHAYITRKFEALLAETYAGVYPTFAKYINERRDWKVKERAAREWLARPRTDDTSPIEVAYYASSLADALEQQGRYEEAWKVVEPHIDVWSANIISGAMSLLDHRGKTEEAIDLGKQYIERYHGADERSDLARICWRHGRFAEAAQLFRPDQRLALNDLRWYLPKAFVETLRGETPARMTEALDALVAAGVDTWVITDVVEEVRDAKLPDHVIAIVDALGKRGWHAGTPHGSEIIIDGWMALREARGIDAATAWLGPRVPDSAATQFVTIAYQNAQHELVLAYATPCASAR